MECDVNTGVRWAMGLIRSAAVRISSNVTSVTGVLIDDIFERFAFQKAVKIFDKKLQSAFPQIGQKIGAMRRNQDIIQTEERRIGRQRFTLENVQGRAANLFFLERGEQRLLIDH